MFFVNNQTYVIFTKIALIGTILLFIGTLILPWQNLLIFLAGLSAIGFFIFIARYPQWGLYLLAFSLPATSWFFYPGNFKIPFVDIIGIFVFCAFCSRLIYLSRANISQFKKEFNFPVLLPYLAFLTVAFLSALYSGRAEESTWYVVRWIVMFYFIYIFLPVNIIRDKKHLQGVIVSIVLSALAVSLMGLASLPQQDSNNEFVRIKPIAIAGIYPIEENQKHISETVLTALALVLAWPLLSGKRKIPTKIWALSAFFALIALGSFARTAWIVLALQACLIIIYYYCHDRINWQKIAAIILILLTISLPAFWYMTKLQTSSTGIGSTESRWLMTVIGFQGWQEHFWLGMGPGRFEPMLETNIYFFAKYGRTFDAHGILQKISTETGILGLAAFFWLSGLIFCKLGALIFKLKQRRQEQEILFYVSLAAVSIFMFEFFDTFYYKGKLWLIVGVALAAAKLINEGKLAPKNYASN
ncbi:MAG: O-antigen ligase family protein [Patescibacteria group bacterium]